MKHVEFIELLGGTSRVASLCGISKGAVSQWKKKGIPLAQNNYLKTKFPKEYRKIFGAAP